MRLKVEDADDDYAVEYFDESVDDDVLMMMRMVMMKVNVRDDENYIS